MRLTPGLTVLVTVFALSIASPALAVTVTGGATLTGGEVVLPVATEASGTVSFTLDSVTGLIDVTGSITGLSLVDITFPALTGLEFGAGGPFHIHNEAAGANGPVVFIMNQASFYTDTATGFDVVALGLTFPVGLVGELLSGDTYFQVHTLAYGGGEIRGQIAAIPEPGTGLLMALGLTFLGIRRSRVRSSA